LRAPMPLRTALFLPASTSNPPRAHQTPSSRIRRRLSQKSPESPFQAALVRRSPSASAFAHRETASPACALLPPSPLQIHSRTPLRLPSPDAFRGVRARRIAPALRRLQ